MNLRRIPKGRASRGSTPVQAAAIIEEQCPVDILWTQAQGRFAAEEVARNLATGRRELKITTSIFVELLPKASGAVAEDLLGAGGGHTEALSGAVLGKVGGGAVELSVEAVQNQLWGWTVDRLPCRKVAKLLTRTVMAKHKMRNDLEKHLQ